MARTEEMNRGRDEMRECHVITRPTGLRDAALWKGPTAICMLLCRRVVEGVESIEVRYSIGSFVGTAEEYLNAIRGHWGIEIGLAQFPPKNKLCETPVPPGERQDGTDKVIRDMAPVPVVRPTAPGGPASAGTLSTPAAGPVRTRPPQDAWVFSETFLFGMLS